MGRLIKRPHENGWISIVEEEDDDGNTLTAFALRPDGTSSFPPKNQFPGGEGDYQDRLERAQAKADYVIVMETGDHATCNCPPWPTGGGV